MTKFYTNWQYNYVYRDGKADYIWTRPIDGATFVWFNNFPDQPAWLSQGDLASGVGVNGANVRYADLQGTGRSSFLAIDPNTNALSAWLNGCDKRGFPPNHYQRRGGPLYDTYQYNIDFLHNPGGCKNMGHDLYKCLFNKVCAPSDSKYDCKHNDRNGVSGQIRVSWSCKDSHFKECMEGVFNMGWVVMEVHTVGSVYNTVYRYLVLLVWSNPSVYYYRQ